jgi:hypothetical protein
MRAALAVRATLAQEDRTRHDTTNAGQRQELDNMHTLRSALTDALSHPPPGLEALARATTNPRLESLQHVLRALSASGDGRLLVVCPRARELDDEIRDAPRVVVWSDPEVREARQRMPPDVVAVVFVSLPGHRGTAHIQRHARQQLATIHHGTVTPRTIRELCEAAGLVPMTAHDNNDNDTKDAPDMPTHAQFARTSAPTSPKKTALVDKEGKLRQGLLATFLQEQADLDADSGVAEIARLAELAETLGLPTTKGSIAEAFYRTRRQKREQDGSVPPKTASPTPRKRHALAIVQTSPAVPDVAPAAPAAPAATPPAPAPDTLQREVAALQSLVEDGLVAMTLVRDSLRQLAPMLAENVELRAKLDTMDRTFRELFARGGQS